MEPSISRGVLALMAALGAVSCGGVTSTGTATRGGGGGASASGNVQSAGGTAPDGTIHSGDVVTFGTGGLPVTLGAGGAIENACVANTIFHDAAPIDLFVMLDQSSAMGEPLPSGSGTWWSAVQTAFSGFVRTRANGFAVGIQYFPLAPDGGTSCTAFYGVPDVPLGQLPDNTYALIASVESRSPAVHAGRPTGPALKEALDLMQAWASTHPGHTPVVTLVTAGLPTECEPAQVSDLAALARAAFEGDRVVLTRVIGLNLGQAGHDLDPIAKAGGTLEATLIEAADIGAPLEKALRSIPGAAPDCSLNIPEPLPGQVLDPNLIGIRFTPRGTGVAEEVQQLNTLGDCDAAAGRGWYFDSPSMPTKIEICPGLCALFDTGVVEVTVGCNHFRGPIPK